MVDCPEGKKIIRWQYPNEDWQRIIRADDYTIARITNQCPNVPYTLYRWRLELEIYKENGINQARLIRKTIEPEVFTPRGFIGSIVGYQLFNKQRQPISFEYYKANPNTRTRVLLIIYHDSGEQITGYPFQGDQGFEPAYFVPSDGREDCTSCSFAATKNGKIVYQRIENVCPQTEEYCEDKTCPKGTCECTHGSIVCCHDSQTGEVIKQFRKYKNS